MDVSKEIDLILKDYEEDISEALENASKKASKDLVRDLRSFNSFKTRGRNYSKGWTRKKIKNGYLVYNKTNPQLTHLLEHGHAVANQYGQFGTERKGAVPHIATREQRYSKEFIEELKKGL